VRASREACVYFHSPAIVNAAPEFAGVDPAKAPGFLSELERRGVTAATGGGLNAATAAVLAAGPDRC